MAEHDLDATRWSSERLRWICIIVAGALAAGLGFVGFWQSFRAQGGPGGILDAIYLTCPLFMFQFTGDLGPKPWPLEVARFLAPAVISYTSATSL